MGNVSSRTLSASNTSVANNDCFFLLQFFVIIQFLIQASVRLTQGLLMAADAGVLLTLPLARPVKVQH